MITSIFLVFLVTFSALVFGNDEGDAVKSLDNFNSLRCRFEQTSPPGRSSLPAKQSFVSHPPKTPRHSAPTGPSLYPSVGVPVRKASISLTTPIMGPESSHFPITWNVNGNLGDRDSLYSEGSEANSMDSTPASSVASTPNTSPRGRRRYASFQGSVTPSILMHRGSLPTLPSQKSSLKRPSSAKGSEEKRQRKVAFSMKREEIPPTSEWFCVEETDAMGPYSESSEGVAKLRGEGHENVPKTSQAYSSRKYSPSLDPLLGVDTSEPVPLPSRPSPPRKHSPSLEPLLGVDTSEPAPLPSRPSPPRKHSPSLEPLLGVDTSEPVPLPSRPSPPRKHSPSLEPLPEVDISEPVPLPSRPSPPRKHSPSLEPLPEVDISEDMPSLEKDSDEAPLEAGEENCLYNRFLGSTAAMPPPSEEAPPPPVWTKVYTEFGSQQMDLPVLTILNGIKDALFEKGQEKDFQQYEFRASVCEKSAIYSFIMLHEDAFQHEEGKELLVALQEAFLAKHMGDKDGEMVLGERDFYIREKMDVSRLVVSAARRLLNDANTFFLREAQHKAETQVAIEYGQLSNEDFKEEALDALKAMKTAGQKASFSEKDIMTRASMLKILFMKGKCSELLSEKLLMQEEHIDAILSEKPIYRLFCYRPTVEQLGNEFLRISVSIFGEKHSQCQINTCPITPQKDEVMKALSDFNNSVSLVLQSHLNRSFGLGAPRRFITTAIRFLLETKSALLTNSVRLPFNITHQIIHAIRTSFCDEEEVVSKLQELNLHMSEIPHFFVILRDLLDGEWGRNHMSCRASDCMLFCPKEIILSEMSALKEAHPIVRVFWKHREGFLKTAGDCTQLLFLIGNVMAREDMELGDINAENFMEKTCELLLKNHANRLWGPDSTILNGLISDDQDFKKMSERLILKMNAFGKSHEKCLLGCFGFNEDTAPQYIYTNANGDCWMDALSRRLEHYQIIPNHLLLQKSALDDELKSLNDKRKKFNLETDNLRKAQWMSPQKREEFEQERAEQWEKIEKKFRAEEATRFLNSLLLGWKNGLRDLVKLAEESEDHLLQRMENFSGPFRPSADFLVSHWNQMPKVLKLLCADSLVFASQEPFLSFLATGNASWCFTVDYWRVCIRYMLENKRYPSLEDVETKVPVAGLAALSHPRRPSLPVQKMRSSAEAQTATAASRRVSVQEKVRKMELEPSEKEVEEQEDLPITPNMPLAVRKRIYSLIASVDFPNPYLYFALAFVQDPRANCDRMLIDRLFLSLNQCFEQINTSIIVSDLTLQKNEDYDLEPGLMSLFLIDAHRLESAEERADIDPKTPFDSWYDVKSFPNGMEQRLLKHDIATLDDEELKPLVIEAKKCQRLKAIFLDSKSYRFVALEDEIQEKFKGEWNVEDNIVTRFILEKKDVFRKLKQRRLWVLSMKVLQDSTGYIFHENRISERDILSILWRMINRQVSKDFEHLMAQDVCKQRTIFRRQQYCLRYLVPCDMSVVSDRCVYAVQHVRVAVKNALNVIQKYLFADPSHQPYPPSAQYFFKKRPNSVRTPAPQKSVRTLVRAPAAKNMLWLNVARLALKHNKHQTTASNNVNVCQCPRSQFAAVKCMTACAAPLHHVFKEDDIELPVSVRMVLLHKSTIWQDQKGPETALQGLVFVLSTLLLEKVQQDVTKAVLMPVNRAHSTDMVQENVEEWLSTLAMSDPASLSKWNEARCVKAVLGVSKLVGSVSLKAVREAIQKRGRLQDWSLVEKLLENDASQTLYISEEFQGCLQVHKPALTDFFLRLTQRASENV